MAYALDLIFGSDLYGFEFTKSRRRSRARQSDLQDRLGDIEGLGQEDTGIFPQRLLS